MTAERCRTMEACGGSQGWRTGARCTGRAEWCEGKRRKGVGTDMRFD